MDFFCARGSSVKKKRIFSAPEGQASKKNEFFLHPRVKRQKKTSFFCTRGSSVKKQWIFSAPEGQASKKNEFFLRPRVKRQKKMDFFCAAGLHVKKTTVVFCQRRLTGEKSCSFTASSDIFSFATASQFGKNTYLCIAK